MGLLSLTQAGGPMVGLLGSLDSTGFKVVVTFTGTSIIGGSLADGRYNLIYNGGYLLSAGSKGQTDEKLYLWRLFGDLGGEATVTAADKVTMMLDLNSRRGQKNYSAYLDYDENGVIISNDLTAFMIRYNTYFGTYI